MSGRRAVAAVLAQQHGMPANASRHGCLLPCHAVISKEGNKVFVQFVQHVSRYMHGPLGFGGWQAVPQCAAHAYACICAAGC